MIDDTFIIKFFFRQIYSRRSVITTLPKSSIKCLILTILVAFGFSSQAQEQLNIQDYTPSNILPKGQFEIKHFNNLYTQKATFDANGGRTDLSERSTFLNSINQINYGLSSINVGVEFWLSSGRVEPVGNTALRIFRFEQNAQQRTAISYIGPKVKLAPIKKWKRLSFQSTFLLPIADDLDGSENGEVFVQQDRFLWINQINYDHQFTPKTSLFLQLSAWWSIDRDWQPEDSFVSSPLTGFISWFPNHKLTIYGMTEFWPTLSSNFSYFFQAGIGTKYQLIDGLLEAELLATDFLAGKNEGAGSTYNWGLRVIF